MTKDNKIDRRSFLLNKLLSPVVANAADDSAAHSLRGDITALRNDHLLLVKKFNSLSALVKTSRVFRSIREFGAKGDGVTDDSEAFQAAVAWAKTQSRWNPTNDPYLARLMGVRIYIPHGDYVINSPKAMLDFDVNVLGYAPWGLCWEGESHGGTQIIYDPITAGPLCYNNMAAASLQFRNLVFTCTRNDASFFESIGPKVQAYTFDHCHWLGQWQYGVHQTGSDNNSEYKFTKCVWLGTFNAFLFGDSMTSDQYLNFWFSECSVLNSSTLIRSLSHGGGHYHLINCDFSGWAPARPTYAVELLGPNRYEGVPSFSAHNCRMEHRNQNALFLKCEWGFGNILIEGSDFGACAWMTASSFSPFYFSRGDYVGPTIRFVTCMLMGKHEYHCSKEAYGALPSVLYDGCQLMQDTMTDDFIITIYDGTGANTGGLPVAHFRNCVIFANQGSSVVLDSDVGWNGSSIGITSIKIISPKMPWGAFPRLNGGAPIQLPKGAVITKIRWFSPASTNSGDTNPFSYRVRTTDTTPTVLDVVSGTNLSAGFDRSAEMFFECNTDARRTLVFDQTASQSSLLTDSYMWIEFIG